AITSAMRKSRKVSDARSTAALAASFQDFVLVPISSMTLYTLSGMAFLLEPSNAAFWGGPGAQFRRDWAPILRPSAASVRPVRAPTSRLSGASRKGYKLLDSMAAGEAPEQTQGWGPLAPNHFC